MLNLAPSSSVICMSRRIEWDAVMDLYVAQRNTLLRDQDHNFKVRQKFTKGHT